MSRHNIFPLAFRSHLRLVEFVWVELTSFILEKLKQVGENIEIGKKIRRRRGKRRSRAERGRVGVFHSVFLSLCHSVSLRVGVFHSFFLWFFLSATLYLLFFFLCFPFLGNFFHLLLFFSPCPLHPLHPLLYSMFHFDSNERWRRHSKTKKDN